MQEKELIEKIKNDDTEAFNILINKYKNDVFRIAMGFLHDNFLAEDVVQEVFIKFWQNRKNFELNAKFSTWLYRVTANTSINLLKKNKFSTFFSNLNKDNNTQYEQQIENTETFEIDTDFKQEHIKNALKTAISSLPKKQKTAFVLSKYQNFSYKEIADIMEISLSSVESLIFRAKQNLQKKLLKTYKSL